MSTTAENAFIDTVPFQYTGYHAFFQVFVHVDAFVTHANGTTTTTRLVNDGPVNCCTFPSGGFSYGGRHAFDVVAGETYGFIVGGRNSDSDVNFFGTLELTDVPLRRCELGSQ